VTYDRDVTLELRYALFEAKRSGAIERFRLRQGPRAQGWSATLWFRDEPGHDGKIHTTSALDTLQAVQRLQKRLGAPR
jgi:hypothetical protein